jgi:hypothetical protein
LGGAQQKTQGFADQTENGGAEGDRTPDLRNAIATLSQLSYGPGKGSALKLVNPSDAALSEGGDTYQAALPAIL